MYVAFPRKHVTGVLHKHHIHDMRFKMYRSLSVRTEIQFIYYTYYVWCRKGTVYLPFSQKVLRLCGVYRVQRITGYVCLLSKICMRKNGTEYHPVVYE